MKEIYDKYNHFVKDDDLTEGYAEWEENYFRMLALSEERLQGREEGLKEGELKRQKSMAKIMKNKNMDINLISEITGLSVEEINNLN